MHTAATPSDTAPIASASRATAGPTRRRRRAALPGTDGRTRSERRFRELIANFAAQIGGPDGLTEIESGLVQQAAMLTLRSELLQAEIIRGADVDPAAVVTIANAVRRILATLGAKAKGKAKPETLTDYLAGKAPRP